jgi:ferritin-like metal-binding protein YciE
MKIKSMEDLMVHELQDLRSAEEQLVEALPKMAEAATAAPLKKAFNEHLKQTKTHLTRLDKALQHMGKGPGNIKCKGMEGLDQRGR